jgi:hypothetical protein
MKALLINCTLKASPYKSNTEALVEVVADALRDQGVEVASVRAVDHSVPPGVESEMGRGMSGRAFAPSSSTRRSSFSPPRPGSDALPASPSGCWSGWTR